jgi:hypothetical protein
MTMPHDPGIVHVHVENEVKTAPVVTEEKEAQHYTCSTFTLPEPIGVLGPVTPTQILQLDPLRKRAILTFSGDGQVILAHSLQQATSLAQNVQQAADEGALVTCPGSVTVEATGPLWAVSLATPIVLGFQTANVSTPTVAGAALATIVNPPSGNYTATVTAYLTGTTTTADQDNIEIAYNGGSQLIPLLLPTVVGAITTPQPYTNPPLQIGGINGINSLIIRTINIPSGTAVYHVMVSIVPDGNGADDPYVAVGVIQERRNV